MLGFPGGAMVKNLPANAGATGDTAQWVQPGREDPLEEEMATDSSILAWRILGTEDLDGLQSLKSQKSQT